MAQVCRLRSVIRQRDLTRDQLLYYFVPKIQKITRKQFHSIIHFNILRISFSKYEVSQLNNSYNM